ncbi:MAG: guanylate kinase [Armatimonadetes bacterium]|nr:guanylate kinase [Armatimonadota bacterium]
MHRGRIFVVSGPSGAGKSTVLARVLSALHDVKFSASATTRQPRQGEQEGVDYYFVTTEKFKEMIAQDAFLEWAQVYSHYYGTPAGYVDDALAAGKDVLLDIDVQGARKVRQKRNDVVYLFLAPPSLQELERRLLGRHTETEERIKVRLEAARKEMSAIPEYDYLVVNEMGHVGDAALRVQSIIEAERARTTTMLKIWGDLVEPA